ncbi:MAG TPA: hypothetical protein VM076_00945, partial [Gemmatimonadaceae bacterium]|nr:hypothetical protein [Gemmatimonadaceae bacterium]
MTSVSVPVSTSATWDARLTSAAIGMTAIAVAAALISQWQYSPMWDGRIYADCITEAARNFTPGALRCAGHASHAYIALVAAVQSIAPGSFPLLLLANAMLLLVACVGFHRL